MRWFLLFYSFFAFAFTLSAGATTDVISIARSYRDGGKYNWNGSGTPEAIVFNNQTILPAGKGTYCSGFTFTVVMRAATARGLLKGKSVEQIKQFQREWYGATKESAEVQAGYAMKRLGIGSNVSAAFARPGDFIQFWRTKKSGHSAIFLGWVVENGKKVGFHYRSTQQSTDGVGDKTEYFEDVPGERGTVIRNRTYFARLNSISTFYHPKS